MADGADVSQFRKSDALTPLMAAAFMGQHTMVDEWLSLGAPINAVNQQGETALMLATNEESINQLLDRGADVTRVNVKGDTALHYLLKNKPVYTPSAVERLVDRYLAAGADKEAVNKLGETPVSLAKKFDLGEI